MSINPNQDLNKWMTTKLVVLEEIVALLFNHAMKMQSNPEDFARKISNDISNAIYSHDKGIQGEHFVVELDRFFMTKIEGSSATVMRFKI